MTNQSMTIKPVKAWAIVNEKGKILNTGKSRTAAWFDNWNEQKTFLDAVGHFKKAGYKCIRVTISPL